ncbi:type IV pili methyl-accepting chemotaxis transducer N-terminal domain-containing protein [Andreprevotia chitinilytica]|uniref:type IV pili methyl-accepting chemotaxis transducer N-terminal domain-containing protein n=1 Tax=Andreprevotia chitinilytica TaxID=396808 RepID=UPI0005533338|nr:type IV pili methyl-accepting chemotaxis transducer N-terminal domain-containing protein [Andreprevotia chitinilytica]
MSAIPPATEPAPRHRLSTRIVAISVAALLVVLTMIGWTLWLSWKLEGAAAAINDTGSLRMRANLLGIELLKTDGAAGPQAVITLKEQQATLTRLDQGVPARPLLLPEDPAIRAQFARVTLLWRQHLQPMAEAALAGQSSHAYLAALPDFVQEADHLVRMIEADNTGKTTLLRLSQGILIVIACVGTLTMIYLLYLWIIVPVQRLQDGLARMAAHEFGVRLPVETRDEFGVLAVGFNRMAEELAGLYHDLEERVAAKTARLAAQNRELETLCDMAAFLNQPIEIDAMCRGFLQRVRAQFGADGGSIRAVDPEGEKLLLVVADGLPPSLENAEHCMKVDDCFCGRAARHGVVVVRDFRQLPQPESYQCTREGFASLAVFQIVSGNEILGSFSLHYREQHALSIAETHLLETLGQHLGVALENRRLAAKARQLAMVQERNLVAQGLHDSLAQGLNFLNFQVQMLEDAVARSASDDITAIVPLLRTGVQESYQDVRELLANFRTKLEQGELMTGIRETVARFEHQSGVAVALDLRDEGAPLTPETQLQVLFVLQEALSNIRKHANARHVVVQVYNQRDFALVVRDDGDGYDPAEVAQRQGHIGLAIMQERAERIGGVLTFATSPGQGVTVTLNLPAAQRQPA